LKIFGSESRYCLASQVSFTDIICRHYISTAGCQCTAKYEGTHRLSHGLPITTVRMEMT